MNTYYLPDDLLNESAARADEVIISYYSSDRDSVKNRIVLNQNMINLLVSGRKTIIYPDATAVVNAGELVVLSTGNVLTSELLAGTDQFTSILFYFSNEVFNRFLIKYEHLLKRNTPKVDKQPFLISGKTISSSTLLPPCSRCSAMEGIYRRKSGCFELKNYCCTYPSPIRKGFTQSKS